MQLSAGQVCSEQPQQRHICVIDMIPARVVMSSATNGEIRGFLAANEPSWYDIAIRKQKQGIPYPCK